MTGSSGWPNGTPPGSTTAVAYRRVGRGMSLSGAPPLERTSFRERVQARRDEEAAASENPLTTTLPWCIGRRSRAEKPDSLLNRARATGEERFATRLAMVDGLVLIAIAPTAGRGHCRPLGLPHPRVTVWLTGSRSQLWNLGEWARYLNLHPPFRTLAATSRAGTSAPTHSSGPSPPTRSSRRPTVQQLQIRGTTTAGPST